MRDAIVVQNVSKQFRRYHADRPLTLQEAFLRGLRRMGPAERFWALHQVSFKIAPGRMVGVVGHNGAGKSTLLRLVGGVGQPDSGNVKVHGRIGALLDLGTGFHSDLTGRENIFINGVISGLTRREVTQRFDSIIAFAELEQFLDNPLRTYSTGMQMRLAFAVAAHIEPEILLIDEVLAVGDMAFQRKCLERITQFKEAGCTILLVSHDSTSVRQLCDEVVWLRKGQLVAYGPANMIMDQYVEEMTIETKRRMPTLRQPSYTSGGIELQINKNRFGSLDMEIIAVRLLDQGNLPITEFKTGDPLRIEIEYLAPQLVEAPIFGVTISRGDGLICYDTSTAAAGLTLPPSQGNGQIVLHLDRLDLSGGQYYIDIGVYEKNWEYIYDYHWHVYPFLVQSNGSEKGLLQLPHHWELQDIPKLQVALPVSAEFW